MRQPLDELLRDLGLLQRHTHTHRGSPRSPAQRSPPLPPHAPAPPGTERSGAGGGGLWRVQGVCWTCLDEAGEKSTLAPTHPPPKLHRALERSPPPPPARPRGLRAARRPLNCATAQPGGRLGTATATAPAWRSVCPAEPSLLSPEPGSTGWKPTPAKRLAEVCPGGREVRRGRGFPRPGEEDGRAPRGQPPSSQRPRRGSRCQANPVPGKVKRVAAQRRARRSPRPGATCSNPEDAAPRPSPGDLRKPGQGRFGDGAGAVYSTNFCPRH